MSPAAAGSEAKFVSSYLVDLTIRHTSWKCVFESPVSTRSRLLRQHSRKMAARNTSSHTERFHGSGSSPARASQVAARSVAALACIPRRSRGIPARRLYIFYFPFFLLVPPLTRATTSASTRPKNGDGRAGPAFYPHVTDALEGEEGGGKRGWAGDEATDSPPPPLVYRARCQSCFHDTAPGRFL